MYKKFIKIKLQKRACSYELLARHEHVEKILISQILLNKLYFMGKCCALNRRTECNITRSTTTCPLDYRMKLNSTLAKWKANKNFWAITIVVTEGKATRNMKQLVEKIVCLHPVEGLSQISMIFGYYQMI
ncbi:hypothetical protein BpHYR1_045246 [Brachionus plicatilis]|uniref:Uncharacterized protein n=1 Tax=Brachionus plicatilis TaxID=10195 RepID=A0A3M7SGD3_BRAPC|nr:hypothetical protein BpHYR1_045246 [Brachionus plicatilis]